MSDFFEYKFRAMGGGGAESPHCTYCREQMGTACATSCAEVYKQLQAERAKDGVIVNDEPARD